MDAFDEDKFGITTIEICSYLFVLFKMKLSSLLYIYFSIRKAVFEYPLFYT